MAGVYSRALVGQRRMNRQEEAWVCRRGQVLSRGVNDRGAITLHYSAFMAPACALIYASFHFMIIT